jgi:hypothetical protein
MDKQYYFMDDSYLEMEKNTEKYINESGVASFLTKDIREMEKKTPLSKDIFLKNGFVEDTDPRLAELAQYTESGEYYDLEREVKSYNGSTFYLTVKPISNYIGREFCCHIDSSDRCTVGCVDLDNVRRFNKFMKLMDINFRLEI